MGSVVTNQSTKCDHGAQRGTFILAVTRVHICVRQLLRHFSGNLRCEPHGGSIGEDRGSLQSQGFILWAPRTTVRHVRVHLTSNTVVSWLQSTIVLYTVNMILNFKHVVLVVQTKPSLTVGTQFCDPVSGLCERQHFIFKPLCFTLTAARASCRVSCCTETQRSSHLS